MGTEYTDDFSKLSGLVELQEAARQLFSAHVLTTEESRNGRILSDTTTKPTLELVENEQMESLKDEAVERLQDAIGDCGDPEMRVRLEGVLSRLHNASSPHEISRMVQEARAAIKEARGGGVSDDDLKKQETAALWEDIHEREAAINKAVQAAYDRGDISYEQYQESLRLQAVADALADDHPDKITATKEANAHDKTCMQEAQKHAEVEGRSDDTKQYKDAEKKADEVEDSLEELMRMGMELNAKDKNTAQGNKDTKDIAQEEVELGQLSPGIAKAPGQTGEISR